MCAAARVGRGGEDCGECDPLRAAGPMRQMRRPAPAGRRAPRCRGRRGRAHFSRAGEDVMRVPATTPEMFPGLLGELTTAATARSEAHPAAVAIHFLVMFSNAVGRGPHFYVAQTRHGMQEFCLVVGPTATGRKGDARHLAEAILVAADPAWAATCIRSGLSSGEGVIFHVRDAAVGIDRKTGEEMVVDAGVADKRLLVVETEFSQP